MNQKIVQIAAQCMSALETVSVCGEHNRVQLSGIYRGLNNIIIEAQKEEEDGGQTDQ